MKYDQMYTQLQIDEANRAIEINQQFDDLDHHPGEFPLDSGEKASYNSPNNVDMEHDTLYRSNKAQDKVSTIPQQYLQDTKRCLSSSSALLTLENDSIIDPFQT